ncbi:MAG: STAS/SEC14 domain-containing protein [Patescibacteria group bacterium]
MSQPLSININEEGIAVIKIAGDLTGPEVEKLNEEIVLIEKEIENAFGKQGKKLRALVDVSEFSDNYDSGAVSPMVNLVSHNRDYIEKTAVFGASPKATLVGETIIGLALRDNFKFFKTKEEALAWLVS